MEVQYPKSPKLNWTLLVLKPRVWGTPIWVWDGMGQIFNPPFDWKKLTIFMGQYQVFARSLVGLPCSFWVWITILRSVLQSLDLSASASLPLTTWIWGHPKMHFGMTLVRKSAKKKCWKDIEKINDQNSHEFHVQESGRSPCQLAAKLWPWINPVGKIRDFGPLSTVSISTP